MKSSGPAYIKKMRDMHTMEYYSVFKKDVNPTICDNVDKSGAYYAMWDKSVTDGQILHYFIKSKIILTNPESIC